VHAGGAQEAADQRARPEGQSPGREIRRETPERAAQDRTE